MEKVNVDFKDFAEGYRNICKNMSELDHADEINKLKLEIEEQENEINLASEYKEEFKDVSKFEEYARPMNDKIQENYKRLLEIQSQEKEDKEKYENLKGYLKNIRENAEKQKENLLNEFEQKKAELEEKRDAEKEQFQQQLDRALKEEEKGSAKDEKYKEYLNGKLKEIDKEYRKEIMKYKKEIVVSYNSLLNEFEDIEKEYKIDIEKAKPEETKSEKSIPKQPKSEQSIPEQPPEQPTSEQSRSEQLTPEQTVSKKTVQPQQTQNVNNSRKTSRNTFIIDNEPIKIEFNAKEQTYTVYGANDKIQEKMTLEDFTNSKEFKQFAQKLIDKEMKNNNIVDLDFRIAYLLNNVDNARETEKLKNYIEAVNENKKISTDIVYNMNGVYGKEYTEELSESLMKLANKQKELNVASVEKNLYTRILEKSSFVRHTIYTIRNIRNPFKMLGSGEKQKSAKKVHKKMLENSDTNVKAKTNEARVLGTDGKYHAVTDPRYKKIEENDKKEEKEIESLISETVEELLKDNSTNGNEHDNFVKKNKSGITLEEQAKQVEKYKVRRNSREASRQAYNDYLSEVLDVGSNDEERLKEDDFEEEDIKEVLKSKLPKEENEVEDKEGESFIDLTDDNFGKKSVSNNKTSFDLKQIVDKSVGDDDAR